MSVSAPSPEAHFLSAVEAGRIFGYTNDYISRLAREKKIAAMRVGRQWFVEPESLGSFIEKTQQEKKQNAERVRLERKAERAIAAVTEKPIGTEKISHLQPRQIQVAPRVSALLQAGTVYTLGLVLGSLIFLGTQNALPEQFSYDRAVSNLRTLAANVYSFHLESPTRTETSVAEQSMHEALIVIPEDAHAESDIAESFSDEVRITYDEDGNTGIITPVFVGDADAESYRFMLVPMKVPDG